MTTDDIRTIGYRLKVWRESKKFSQPDAAAHLGMPYDSLQKYENDLRKPGADALECFYKGGINTNWLLSGEGEMFAADYRPASPYDFKSDEPFRHRVSEQHAPYGFLLVPRYDVAGSMGNGSMIHSEQIVDHLAFRESWVRTELGANPNNLILISAVGDSMEPTLRAGDLLLIDRGVEGVKQDSIYAFATNGELRVKRMQLKMDGSVMVKSDNAKYDPELLTPDQAASILLVGRVVWSGRRM